MIYLSMGVYNATNVIDYIQPDSPAEVYGFLQGDEIVSLNETPINTWEDFSSPVRSYPGGEVTFEIIRNGS